MTVRCAHCGEEMLGAVNRCWKCGHQVSVSAELGELPPVRPQQEHIPLPVDASDMPMPLEAEVLPEEDDSVHLLAALAEEHSPYSSDGAELPPISPQVVQHQPLPTRRDSMRGRGEYRHPAHHPTAATGGAMGSLLLGVVSIVVSWFTVSGMLLAVFGLALGAWGISSNRRKMAAAGMILCCIALTIGSMVAALWMYDNLYGGSPWAPAPPIGFESESEFDQ